MNVVRIYKMLRAVYAVAKIAIPVLEDLFQKDLNKDGVIGSIKNKSE
jgi:hypothetical protein